MSLSFIPQQSERLTDSGCIFIVFLNNTKMRKRRNLKKGRKCLEWKLIAWHKNTSYSPTVLLQRLLNPAFKQKSIATSLEWRESFINSGCESNAGLYYSSQLLHLSSNSWLFCSELLGVLNLQQNRRQISSPGAQWLNAFLLFYFLIRA